MVHLYSRPYHKAFKPTMRLAKSPERGTYSDTMRKIMTRIQLMSVKIQMMVQNLRY